MKWLKGTLTLLCLTAGLLALACKPATPVDCPDLSALSPDVEASPSVVAIALPIVTLDAAIVFPEAGGEVTGTQAPAEDASLPADVTLRGDTEACDACAPGDLAPGLKRKTARFAVLPAALYGLQRPASTAGWSRSTTVLHC